MSVAWAGASCEGPLRGPGVAMMVSSVCMAKSKKKKKKELGPPSSQAEKKRQIVRGGCAWGHRARGRGGGAAESGGRGRQRVVLPATQSNTRGGHATLVGTK